MRRGSRSSARRPALALAALLATTTLAAHLRVAAPPEREWSPRQQALFSTYSALVPADGLRALLVHPDLLDGALPFARYLATQSTLPPRHRALLLGLGAPSTPFETALARAATELHEQCGIADATWALLDAEYSTQQLIDAVFTVANHSMLEGVWNTLGVQQPARGRAARRRTPAPLAAPRIAPLEPAAWTPEVRKMLDPEGSGRPVAAIYRTFAQHPALYPSRQNLSEYIRLRNTLPPRVREMLILRIGYLCGSDYEWAAHAPAGRRAGLTDAEVRRLAGPLAGWSPADTVIIRAVDELYARDAISESTWKALDAQFDDRQLLDLLITTGGYRMVSMALNAFGVPLESGSEVIPRAAARR